MTHLLKKSCLILTVLPLTLFATDLTLPNKTKDLAIYYTFPTSIEKEYNTLVEKKLKSIGFNCLDPHKRINDKYKQKWKSTELDILSFMPIVKDRTIIPLLNIDPRIAAFAPFNLVIHKKLDENITYVGHLVPEVMLDILGIENKEIRKKFSVDFKALDATIAQEIGGKTVKIPYKKLPKDSMINFEYAFDKPKDMEDFVDEFQYKFETTFTKKGYLIAGYHNFMKSTDDAEEILSDYDAFWTYSLCHLKFSYNMFDTKGARPDAGLFAPCAMYMYIRKGSNKIVGGMPKLQNWSDTLDIKDEKRLELIKKLDIEIPKILTEFGMKHIPNTNPLLVQKSDKKSVEKTVSFSKTIDTSIPASKVGLNITIPTVPKVISITPLKNNTNTDRSIKFSKRIPPNYVPDSFDTIKKEKTSKPMNIGEVNNGKISAYLRGQFLDVKTVIAKLTEGNFKVIATTPINKKGTLISLVFTHDKLLSLASKKDRGFIASLRVLIDTKEKTINITNPLYMAKGFLQSDFNEKIVKEILVQLIDLFPNLKNSKDMLKYQMLSTYQFMNGMPKYQNMIEVASGNNLLEKIKENEKVVFTQTLKSGATLIGVQLSKRTQQFTKKIGRNNAAMLPYPILIENGKAKILDPKFYISFMYPMLTMSQFMAIATVPDAMVKDCERVFK